MASFVTCVSLDISTSGPYHEFRDHGAFLPGGSMHSLIQSRETRQRSDDLTMARNQRIGTWGERAASDYLQARGFEILERNLRTPYGEIDLLAMRDRQTIFVEVKTRTSTTLGPPEISVSPRKQAHMIACAEYHAQQHQIDHWRIDVVAVERSGEQVRITHFENAVS